MQKSHFTTKVFVQQFVWDIKKSLLEFKSFGLLYRKMEKALLSHTCKYVIDGFVTEGQKSHFYK